MSSDNLYYFSSLCWSSDKLYQTTYGILDSPSLLVQMFGSSPETERLNSLPSVGVEAALREVMEEMEELLSARARGAKGGGLHEWTGALKGQVWETIHMNTPKQQKK